MADPARHAPPAPEGHSAADIAAQQRLRRTRNLMAAATALLLAFAVGVYAWWGVVPASTAWITLAMVAALIGAFYGAFASGLNLRFPDPSLTTAQILAAIGTLGFVAYLAEPVRDALMPFYCMALLFGAFRYGRERMLVLAAAAIAAHGAALLAWHAANPGAEPARSFVAMLVMLVVMPWFAIMAGYVHALRERIVDSHRRLRAALARIEEIAAKDELTGVLNRRSIMEALQREISRMQRAGGRFSICLLDLDHFKSVNDTYGHARGDLVLKRFTRVASDALRDVDLLGRYGGEEFLVVLPGADARGAVACAERVRVALEACEWPELVPARTITVTAGLASWKEGDSAFSILARADEALYAGKGGGRNRVVHMA